MQAAINCDQPTYTPNGGLLRKVPQGRHGWLVNNAYWLKKCTSQVSPHQGTNAFYDDMGKVWMAERGDTRQSLMLDFGKPVELSAYKYHTGPEAGGHCPREIQLSFTDGIEGEN